MSLTEPVRRFKTGVFRANLKYEVLFNDFLDDDPFTNLIKFINEHLTDPNDVGIVYCRARDACTQVASRLQSKNISAKAYHAGLKNGVRDEIQDEWMQGRTKVICATIR